jgi:DNA-binding CsgD family transcriptional regulator
VPDASRPRSRATRKGAGAKQITARDFAALQRAILALHSHRDMESFRRAVPHIFLGLIPAQHFSLANLRVDPDRREIRILDLWEWPVRFVGERFAAMERNLYDHPFAVHARKHGTDGAMRLSDFLTLPQLRRTALYREALRPTQRGRLLSIGAMGGPGMGTLSLSRPESEPDFTERERRLLEMLRPHFDQARLNLESESLSRASRYRSLKGVGLTPREIEVALWLAQGKTNPEVALILATPVRTIEKHVERILRKLGVENRVAAAVTIAEILRA